MLLVLDGRSGILMQVETPDEDGDEDEDKRVGQRGEEAHTDPTHHGSAATPSVEEGQGQLPMESSHGANVGEPHLDEEAQIPEQSQGQGVITRKEQLAFLEGLVVMSSGNADSPLG